MSDIEELWAEAKAKDDGSPQALARWKFLAGFAIGRLSVAESDIAAHDADVRKAAMEEAAQIAEHTLTGQLFSDRDTRIRLLVRRIRAAALGDAPTTESPLK